jgi:hypothetical protein
MNCFARIFVSLLEGGLYRKGRRRLMESLLQDLKFGVRLLWKDKGFASTAIATLAICIAANTAIFSVIHAVVLKPLPLPEPDRLLILYNSYPRAARRNASRDRPTLSLSRLRRNWANLSFCHCSAWESVASTLIGSSADENAFTPTTILNPSSHFFRNSGIIEGGSCRSRPAR